VGKQEPCPDEGYEGLTVSGTQHRTISNYFKINGLRVTGEGAQVVICC
jgi:hypothetical protein